MGTALHLLSLIYLERMAVAFYVEDLFLPSLHFFCFFLVFPLTFVQSEPLSCDCQKWVPGRVPAVCSLWVQGQS